MNNVIQFRKNVTQCSISLGSIKLCSQLGKKQAYSNYAIDLSLFSHQSFFSYRKLNKNQKFNHIKLSDYYA